MPDYIRRNKAICWFSLFFAFIIFVKILVFQHITAGGLMFRSLWNAPLFFWSWLLPKIAISVFIASFVFIAKRQYWTVIVGFFIDLWCIANAIYFRAYDGYFDIYTIQLGGNMKGFWSSVIFFTSWKDLLFPLLTLTYLPLALKVINTKRFWHTPLIGVALFIALSYFSTGILIANQEKTDEFSYNDEYICYNDVFSYNPFSEQTRKCFHTTSKVGQICSTSIIHDAGYIINDYIYLRKNYTIPFIDYNDLRNMLSTTHINCMLKNPCIIVIVESLEDWAVNEVSMPHLSKYMKQHPHLHAHKIKKQTLSGNSADGQLIINTGLLPLTSGVTCYMFPYNQYPSIADCCSKKAATILPHSIESWNQQYMSPAYHYDTTIVRNANDSILFETTLELLHGGYDCIQVITLSTHAPFDYGASRSDLVLPQDMPLYMSQYMKSVYYFDSGLNMLLEQLASDTLLQKTSVIITGDHTIFYHKAREKYHQYVEQNNLNYRVNEGYCPLIILSDNISETITIDEPCYQMDIFPTIMHVTGCNDYYWKGLGVNLFDTLAIKNRELTEEQCYDLSDRLIRNNWFKQYYE